jgi:hypothetical protein
MVTFFWVIFLQPNISTVGVMKSGELKVILRLKSIKTKILDLGITKLIFTVSGPSYGNLPMEPSIIISSKIINLSPKIIN